jgi:hypothetical protein
MFQFMSTVFLPLKSSPDSLDSVIGKIHPGIKKQQANVVAFASMNGGVTRAYATSERLRQDVVKVDLSASMRC